MPFVYLPMLSCTYLCLLCTYLSFPALTYAFCVLTYTFLYLPTPFVYLPILSCTCLCLSCTYLYFPVLTYTFSCTYLYFRVLTCTFVYLPILSCTYLYFRVLTYAFCAIQRICLLRLSAFHGAMCYLASPLILSRSFSSFKIQDTFFFNPLWGTEGFALHNKCIDSITCTSLSPLNST